MPALPLIGPPLPQANNMFLPQLMMPTSIKNGRPVTQIIATLAGVNVTPTGTPPVDTYVLAGGSSRLSIPDIDNLPAAAASLQAQATALKTSILSFAVAYMALVPPPPLS